MSGDLEFSFSQKPLVSVVTTAYNEENFIRSNMQSVSEQTYPNIEHIIVDDGSTDRTTNKIKNFDHEKDLKYIGYEENKGQLDATKTALEVMNGEIMLWVNADDLIFKKDSVSNIVDEYISDPGTQVLYTDYAIIDKNGVLQRIKKTHPHFSYRRLKLDNFSAFICYRKDVLKEFPMDPQIRYVMDYAFALKLAKRDSNFKYSPNIILGHRFHENTLTNNMDSEMTGQSWRYRNEEHNVTFDTLFKLQHKLHLYEMMALQSVGVYDIYSIFNNRTNLTRPVELYDTLQKQIINQLPINLSSQS